MNIHELLRNRAVPFIPKPDKKEIPVREELVQDMYTQRKVHMVKSDNPILIPNYNTLYDTFGSQQAFEKVADIYVNGTLTTVANSTVSSAVNAPSDPKWRLEQWPGGVQLYLLLRWFSVASTTATFTTLGAIRATFTDTAGNATPIGCFRTNESVNVIHDAILPSPITDTGKQAFGTIDFFLNSGATVGDYLWQLGFSAVYLLPALKGYTIERLEREEQEI